MKTSRRTILAGLAALPAAGALPAVPMPDPVFAAIEAHRAAYIALGEALRGPGGMSPIPPHAHAAGDAERDALYDLANTVPTSLAGLRAMIEYLGEVQEEAGDPHDVGEAMPAIIVACRALLPSTGGAA